MTETELLTIVCWVDKIPQRRHNQQESLFERVLLQVHGHFCKKKRRIVIKYLKYLNFLILMV